MYKLPELPYEYNALEPFIDEQTMRLHHDKHHSAYVKGANLALEKLDEIRKIGDKTTIKPWLMSLSFNASGHFLHSLFWQIMASASKNKLPKGKILDAINKDFGSLDNLLIELGQTAMGVEGSGWAALVYDMLGNKLITIPIEKHNLLGIQGAKPILVLDVWEHAYYLKYQNDRQTYVNNFEKLINWQKVSEIFEK